MQQPGFITSRHRKPIAEDGYYLTQSCIMGAVAPSVEPLVARVFDLLGRRWAMTNESLESRNTCCSGMVRHSDLFTPEASLLVTARLWSLCAEAGFDNLATVCVTSYAMHQESLKMLRDVPELPERIDRQLQDACGRRLVMPKSIVHCSDIFYRYRAEIARHFRHRLVDHRTGEPLRVVDHVGCHYNKLFPGESVGGQQYCDVLAGMVRQWGGVEVDYPERRHCCGMGFRQCVIRPNRGFTAACVRKKLESMAPFRPDLIVTNCPGCLMTLDREQGAVTGMTGTGYHLPVLNYAELAGLLLGWDPYDVVGVQSHSTPVEPLLERLGIPHDPGRAYATANRERITQGAS